MDEKSQNLKKLADVYLSICLETGSRTNMLAGILN